MTATLPGTTTFMVVEMRTIGCEVSEVSSLTSQRPQLRRWGKVTGCRVGGGNGGDNFYRRPAT